MAESFENLDNILHDWEKDKTKKSIVEALNRYEKHSLAGKRMTKPFSFLENGTEKITNKQNVYEIDSFHKFNFPQWQEIIDTLIDVRNAKHQKTTS